MPQYTNPRPLEWLRAQIADTLKIPCAVYGFNGGNIKTTAAVVSVTGENDYRGNGVSIERAREVSVDLYVAGSGETYANNLVALFHSLALPYRCNTVIFENDTNLVHYEYITEI